MKTRLYRKCEWGYLIKATDSQSCYAALIDFIEHKNEWIKMQDASLKMAKKFNIELTAQNYNKAYLSVYSLNLGDTV